MGGHIEILQLGHPDSAVFPASLFEWAGDRGDPYVEFSDEEAFFRAIDRFRGCVRRHETPGDPFWSLRSGTGDEPVLARPSRYLRIPEPDPHAQRALRDATFDACAGDFRLLTTRPDLLPPGATYPLVGLAFDRNAPCSSAALDLLVHLLPAYPKAVVWYTGGDRVYDVAAFRACVAQSMMS